MLGEIADDPLPVFYSAARPAFARESRTDSELYRLTNARVINIKPLIGGGGDPDKKIVGSSGHEKVPTRGKPGLEQPGRPRGERIERQALVDPTVTRSTIRADVGVVVPQTISRHLAEANLKSKRPFHALPLLPEHRQLRLHWCQARSMWNVTDWQKVVFRDEFRFVLGTDDNRVRVWRHPEPFLNGLPGAVFQQDNARPHTARVAQDFLRHFQTLPWPARSPDLFPVEHVWDQLKRQMPSCHSVHDLELAVQDSWVHLPQDNIRCLINSMPDRVAACIAAGGGPTRY
ncbi:transposable element Tcb2 transposase [Trichonephila clavipes]|uniref:Transposable element Tcb2 transposase n=1 Tax=Trichonephila clavipes TaxID=2585209 RepID=A0A8X6V688_TRICX|nr:transposable element Tcb2 transposase [Trichonephila clavipes]